MAKPYILKMTPYLRQKVWGGRKLADLFGKRLPDSSPYGEAWEVSDRPEGQSHIANGPWAGKPLSMAIDQWNVALTGPDGDTFPLLVKVLDARHDLSVQVHPGDADIKRLELAGQPKDECWLILDVDPGGCILHGFEAPTNAAAFRAAVESGRAAQALRRIQVAPGDVIRVSPGTIHAICRGVCLLEIQQPSDTTYRVYDYDRLGLDDQPRALHLDQAMQVADLSAHRPARSQPTASRYHASVTVLMDTDAYRIERANDVGNLAWTVDAANGPQVVFCETGRVHLAGPRETVDLTVGETAVVPAGIGAIRIDGPPAANIVVAGRGRTPLVGKSSEACT